MKLLELLSDPATRPVFGPAALVALALVVLTPALSVFVAVRKLAFLGQGVSHAAFGGVGVALVLGLAVPFFAEGWGLQIVVLLFCLAAALGIARLSRSSGADTAIGMVLAVSMALGFVLHRIAATRAFDAGMPAPPEMESVLFGSVIAVTPAEAWAGWISAALITLALAWRWRPLTFYALDESGAEAFGVNTERERLVLIVLLTIAVVIATRLAGVVLATALLVIPGAAALRLASRMPGAIAWSALVTALGVIGGLAIAVEADIEPAPAIVLVLAVCYAVARIAGRTA